MGASRTSPQVLRILTERRGQDVSAADLVSATGLDHTQVRNAVRSLINREDQPIVVIQRGNMWRLGAPLAKVVSRPPRVADQLFERIGQTSDGDVLVKGDQTDTIYRLTAL